MKHILIMLGGPGAGKGTIGKMIMAQTPYHYVESGAMFRAQGPDTEVGKIIATGNLVPDEILFKMVESYLKTDQNMLFDGLPRTIPQAQWIVKWADKNGFGIKVVYLNAPAEILIGRMQKRANETPVEKRRADDLDPAIMQNRVKTFFDKTMPLIEFFKTQPGVEFLDIDDVPPEQQVFADVMSKL
ncbi:MAG: nucleoside monophosphate kinase [Rickettsiales bacterium]|nr:nucleoside monophosphate kinase [Rickettsiales bacterium]